MSTCTLRIELRVAAQWSRIESVRTAVGLCVGLVYADENMCRSISMAAAELMENAIKYGRADENRVTLAVTDEDDEVVVEVTNHVDGEAAHARVAARLAWIASFATPNDAYQAAILAMPSEDGPVTSSGLGLARIAHEGGCRLSMATRGDELTLRAHHPLLVAAR